MKCICSGEQLRIEDIIPSSESLATRDYSASGYSSRAGDDAKADTSNIEEAESSLRESGILNYEVGVTKVSSYEVSFSFDPIINIFFMIQCYHQNFQPSILFDVVMKLFYYTAGDTEFLVSSGKSCFVVR